MLSKYFKIKTQTKEFDTHVRNTIENLKGKKVLVYGAGQGFTTLNKKYLFNENLNIVAIADKKFERKHNKFFNGIKAIEPKQISNEDFDVILISNENTKIILKYLLKKLKLKNKEIMTVFNEEFKDERTNFYYLQKIKFSKILSKLIKKYQNKTLMLYGAGAFLEVINKYYDITPLNIIGISDKRFKEHKDGETFLGYKVYAPQEIKDVKPDYVIITAKNYVNIVKKIYKDIIENSNIEFLPLIKRKRKSFFEQFFTIAFSGLFDKKYYLKNYGDKLDFLGKTFPLWHYITKGWKLKYNPSDKFASDFFYDMYFWIEESPLYHYLKYFVKYKTFLHPRNYYIADEKTIENYINAKNKRGKSKKVIYTCITGGYDDFEAIKSHYYVDNSWDYICFTDDTDYVKAGQFGIWEVRPLEYTKLDMARNNRWHKMHPHVLFPDYEESVYIDANINILTDRIFKQLKKWKKDLLLPKRLEHPCIYHEYKWVYLDKVDKREIVRKEWKYIKQAGMPRKYGACECNLIYRKHNKGEIIKMMEEWWYFIENYSKRDQLAFPFIMWKNKRKIKDYSIDNLKPYYKDYCIFMHISQI